MFNREEMGANLDPANAPHGFNEIDVPVTMTAAEWGIISSAMRTLGRFTSLPSYAEMSEKINGQVIPFLNAHGGPQ